MKKFSLDYDAIKLINPKIIYASISGYGQTGPLKNEPAYDTVIQAMSGLMSMNGFADEAPVRVGASIADLSAGLFGFSAISTALYAREKTGLGTHIDIAMLDSIFSLLEHGIMHQVAYGEDPPRIGNKHPSISPFSSYHTQDRDIVICAGNDILFDKLCKILLASDIMANPLFKSNELRLKNDILLTEALEKILILQPANYWVEKIDKAGIPVSFIHTIGEAMANPQIAARNMLIKAGNLTMPGCALKFSNYPDFNEKPLAPKLNADAEKIRREFS